MNFIFADNFSKYRQIPLNATDTINKQKCRYLSNPVHVDKGLSLLDLYCPASVEILSVDMTDTHYNII